jgi:hypothetical protein
MSILSTGLSRDERTGLSRGKRLSDGAAKPLTVTVNTTCALTGLGPTKIWTLIKEGRLDVVRLDGRTLVKFPSLERLLAPDPSSQPAPRPTPRRRRRPAKVRPAEGAEAK